MKSLLLITAVAALSTVPPAVADVLDYRGAGNVSGGLSISDDATVHFTNILLTDVETDKSPSVLTFRLDGEKDSGPNPYKHSDTLLHKYKEARLHRARHGLTLDKESAIKANDAGKTIEQIRQNVTAKL